jgi:peptide/nickel transport system permease protein
VLLIVVAIFAPLIATHSPTAQDLTHTFASPSSSHWLGTDDLGRDVFSRLVYGARPSLRAAFEVVALALLFAVPIGLFAGYRGGQVDYGIMRVMDGGLAFPPLVLALAVVAVLGPGLNNTALALAVVFTPSFVRLIRGQTLAVREESFVEASRALGSRPVYLVGRRVFPNVAPPIIVQASLALGGALLAEAALSFLGLGTQPPQPSWGSMLQEAYNTALFTHPWSLVVPGLAIASAVLAFNTIGDGLTAALGVSPPKRSGLHHRGSGKARLGLTQVNRTAGSETAAAPPVRAGVSAGGPCLAVEGLTVVVATEAGQTPVVEDVSFTVNEGETLGLVGESGSGKTVTSLAVMRLLPSPPFEITAGQVRLGGEDLLSLDFDRMRQVRGGLVSMIFQDPMTSLNPARTVGAQLAESIRLHQRVSRAAARRRAVEMLDRVGIADPASRAKSFPHQLSGGMRQRVMIAMALSSHPRLLIADEPTTALDVTVQAQILDLLRELSRTERLAVIFVTHDLGVVAEICDRVAVMYAGQIVEVATTSEIYRSPRHPYTEGLIAASRAIAGGVTPIGGDVPSVGHFPSGCRFHPRCSYAIPQCAQAAPELAIPTEVAIDIANAAAVGGDGAGHQCRCWRQSELTLKGMA